MPLLYIPVFLLAALILKALLVDTPKPAVFTAARSETLARPLLVEHEAVREWYLANSSAVGAAPVQPSAGLASTSDFASCTGSKIAATWYTQASEIAQAGLIIQGMVRLDPNDDVGLASGTGSATVATPDGRTVNMPCAIPTGAPVKFTQILP